MLRGLQNGRFDGCRYLDRDEAISGEQVVLAALVDNAKVLIALGVLVWKDNVDFVALKRGLVAVVLDADRELAASRALTSATQSTYLLRLNPF
jgi:hypothetical protein